MGHKLVIFRVLLLLFVCFYLVLLVLPPGCSLDVDCWFKFVCSAGWSVQTERSTESKREKHLGVSLIGDCARCPLATDAASCTAERWEDKEKKRQERQRWRRVDNGGEGVAGGREGVEWREKDIDKVIQRRVGQGGRGALKYDHSNMLDMAWCVGGCECCTWLFYLKHRKITFDVCFYKK